MTINGSELPQTYSNFIVDSWLKSYKHSEECKFMHTSVYKSIFWNIIQNELKNSKVKLVTDDNKKIKAYIVYEKAPIKHESEMHTGVKPIIKYLYSTSIHRRNGNAKALLKLVVGDDKWAYCCFVNSAFVSFCHKIGISHMYLPNLRRMRP